MVVVLLLLLFLSQFAGIAQAAPDSRLPMIEPNDNLRSAGTFDRGTLTVALRAAPGRWQPEGPHGPTLQVEAFGEEGKALSVPAPLIRVVEGSEIAVSVRNELDAALVITGLCARDGSPCPRLEVPPHEMREVRFNSGPAGTYHYWASTLGAPIPFRELAGALVVDKAGAPPQPDRIIVITEFTELTAQQLREIMTADDAAELFVKFKPRVTFVLNGLSWPATKRLTYDVGERVRWRIINVSSQAHPLHLHGFYFDVDSLGNGIRDTVFDDAHRRRVVTQLLPPGGTMAMTWVPERPGNWLFHCHVMHHVSPARRLSAEASPDSHSAAAHARHGDGRDKALGMAGMVIGVTVRGAGEPTRSGAAATAPRKLRLVMQRAAGGHADVPPAGFILTEGADVPPSNAPPPPGPPIVLRRNQPVEITVENRLPEATAIHWHGMELESYFDGVHGFSGFERRVTPMIEPGGTFVVKFTPPRAGTFIYHTHLHDYRQLSSGLYGPLIVTDGDETFDPATDHVVTIARSGLATEEPSILAEPESVVINGARAPRLVWKAGVRHRVRLINITPDDIFSVTLQTSDGPVTWKPLAKDGVAVPAAESVAVPARQTIAVGETYDFEYEAPPGRKTAWIEVRTPAGKWQAQGHVVIK